MRGLIARRPIASFVVVTFVVSYTVGPAVAWLAGAWIRPLSEIAAHYVGRIGVVFGPAIAALVLASFAAGQDGMRRLLLRLTVRRDVWWIGLIPVLTLTVATLACMAAGTPRSALASALGDGWTVLLAHYALSLLTAGIGEELGWRGWLLPNLLARHSRASATLVVATVWCVWHLPKLLSGGGVAVALVVLTYALSFMFTVLWSYTRGSILAVAVAHASVNAPFVFYETTLGYERTRAGWFVTCALSAAAAVVLVAARWPWWRSTAAEFHRVEDESWIRSHT